MNLSNGPKWQKPTTCRIHAIKNSTFWSDRSLRLARQFARNINYVAARMHLMLVPNHYSLINRTHAFFLLSGTTLNYRNAETSGTMKIYWDLIPTRWIALHYRFSCAVSCKSLSPEWQLTRCFTRIVRNIARLSHQLLRPRRRCTTLLHVRDDGQRFDCNQFRLLVLKEIVQDDRKLAVISAEVADFFTLLPFFNALLRAKNHVWIDFKLDALTEHSTVRKYSKLSKRTQSPRWL